jgi:OmpR-family two-component system manganese-sensing response regulator
MKLLLAEDDVRLGKLIHHMLTKKNHLVDVVRNGQDALDYAFAADYDVIILDWMMPGMDGLQVCQTLRKNGYHGGILMLTAKDDLEDIVAGLNGGADDYLVKPFKMEELLARIRALLRRKDRPYEQKLEAGHLILNVDTCTAICGGKEIELTKKEYQLLEYLIRNKGRVLTREQIIARIWGLDADISNNALDALVKLVRKKIDQKDSPSLIQNVRGVGYKIRDDHA